MAAEIPGDVEVAHLDLADLTSVRKFADSVDTVDVMVTNAGVLGLPLTRTADGFEIHMGTNYLGHFALTCLLGDRIRDRLVVTAELVAQLSAERKDRRPVEHHRRDKRSAAGNIYSAGVQAIRQAQGDQAGEEGRRRGSREPTVEAVR